MSRWPKVAFSDLTLDAQNGFAARTGSGELTVVLRLADIDSDTWAIASEELRQIGMSAEQREKYALAVGDLLVVRVNGSPKIAGRIVAYAGPPGLAYCDHFIRFRMNARVVPKFIAYQFRHRPIRSQVEAGMVSTAGQHTVSQRTFAGISVSVAPFSEQLQIVKAIETQFTRLDEASALLERAKANLKRARASVLKAAVEGRLVPTEAALARSEGRDYEHASVLLTRTLAEGRARGTESGERSKYREPKAPQNVSEPAPKPEGWTWATLEQVSARIVDCLHSTPKFVSSGYACLDTNAMGAGTFRLEDLRYVDQLTFNERNRRLVPQEGDIVFAREGTVGNAVVLGNLAVCLGQRTMLIRTSLCYPRLIMHWMMSPFVRKQYAPLIAGSTVAHLNMADIRRFILPLPPLAEQHRIVAEVDRRLSVLDAIEQTINADLARTSRLRQSIVKCAFEGSLVPSAPRMTGDPQLRISPQDAAR